MNKTHGNDERPSQAKLFAGRWRRLRALWVCALAVSLPFIQAGAPTANAPLVDLGDGKFQLGAILIDKSRRSFSVAGSVIRDFKQPLLEYFAVKKGGMKAYEAVLDLNTTAREFNIACIFIGLDAARAVLPKFHFDEQPITGDEVDVTVQWGKGEAAKTVQAEELFLIDGKRVEDDKWVYTGSIILPDGRYLAEEAGTLIGFIHDQDSIIEHANGIALGQMDKLRIDKSLLPPVGGSIVVTVRNVTASQ